MKMDLDHQKLKGDEWSYGGDGVGSLGKKEEQEKLINVKMGRQLGVGELVEKNDAAAA